MNKKIVSIIILFININLFAQDYKFYGVDTLKSKIYWKCDKHNGFFKLKNGGFVVENNSILAGKFNINIHSLKDMDMDVKQFGTAVLIFENTLKNEFLEVEKYPDASFELIEISKIKDNIYDISGDLTLHGITICIRFKANISIDKKQVDFKSEKITIDRTDWGIYRMSPKRPYSDDENNWTVPDLVEIIIEMKLSETN